MDFSMPDRNHVRCYFRLTLAFCIGGVPAAYADEASPKQPLSVNVGVESFRWSEYDAGQRLLRETGPRLTAGITLDHLLHGDLAKPYTVEVRGYLGFIDYDGQTQAGISAKTDVDYIGVSGEVMGGVRLAGSRHMDLLGGLGVDTWTRDIQDGVAADGSPALGYQEDYFILYGKLGPGFLFQNGVTRSYLQFGIKYPFYTYEQVHLSTIGFDSDVDLKPGKKISGFAKWRMSWGREGDKPRFGASIYYDSFRFSASGSKTVTGGGVPYSVHQPESRMDVLGARLEYYF
jgi:hypothetical protein